MTEHDANFDKSTVHFEHHGDNVAHLAMQYGFIDIARYIAEKDISLFILTNSASLTPLASAAAGGRLDAINFFFKEIKPKLNDYNLKDENVLSAAIDIGITYCIREDKYQLIKTLLDNGCTPNNSGSHEIYNDPDIWVVASCLSTDFLRLLYKYGGNVNAVNPKGDSCLHEAITSEVGAEYETINFLLSNGVYVHTKNMDGLNAIDLSENSDDDIKDAL